MAKYGSWIPLFFYIQGHKKRGAAAIDQKKNRLSFFDACQQAVPGRYIRNRFFIELNNDITGGQTGILGRGTAFNLNDNNP
jgi:hypothetical protein